MNWQNFRRQLQHDELSEIRFKLSGMHFAKESLSPLELQALYCGEALLREVELLREKLAAVEAETASTCQVAVRDSAHRIRLVEREQMEDRLVAFANKVGPRQDITVEELIKAVTQDNEKG